MLDWIVEALWSAVSSVPAWILAEDSPNFLLVRAMFGLLLIVLVAYVIALRPVRSRLSGFVRKMSRSVLRR
jgi:hypothetical protein